MTRRLTSHLAALTALSTLSNMVADRGPVIDLPRWKVQQADHPQNPTPKRAKVKAARKQRNAKK